jgi:hypothetical protein
MTQFVKSKFSYHGGYLMYRGDYEGRPVYPDDIHVHPTMVGRGADLFIARFKHRGAPVTKSQFMKELCESFTVEEYAVATSDKSNLGSSPINVLKDNNPEWYENIMSKWLMKQAA